MHADSKRPPHLVASTARFFFVVVVINSPNNKASQQVFERMTGCLTKQLLHQLLIILYVRSLLLLVTRITAIAVKIARQVSTHGESLGHVTGST
jgi:NADH:ubiquinone oxidoreductase subunit 6 (subunit J)